MSEKWDYYRESRPVAGMRVIERLAGGTQRETVYRVACIRCGHEAEVTHRTLSIRARAEHRRCRACKDLSDEQAAEALSARYARRVVVAGWDLASSIRIPGGLRDDRTRGQREAASYGRV